MRRREKRMIGAALGLMVVLVVVLVVAVSGSSKTSGHGCVSVALAYSTGGDQIYRCGEAARALCAAAGQPGGITGATGRAVAVECRKAGLRVG